MNECQEREKGQVMVELDLIRNRITELGASIGTTMTFLAPVLRQPNPKDEKDCIEEKTLCELASQIRAERYRVEKLGCQLIDLRQRLEL